MATNLDKNLKSDLCEAACRDISSADWAESEIASYRKGFITLRFDFQRQLMIWRDSNQWFNDFIRSLPEEQAGQMRESLANFVCHRLSEAEKIQANGRQDVEWTVRWGKNGSAVLGEISGDLSSPAWKDFAMKLASASQQYLEF